MKKDNKANLRSSYTSATILNHKEICFLFGGMNTYIGTDLEPLIKEMSEKLLSLYENATGVKYPEHPPIKKIDDSIHEISA